MEEMKKSNLFCEMSIFLFCEAYLMALVWYSDLFCLPQELVRDLEQCFLCLYGHPSKKAKVCE